MVLSAALTGSANAEDIRHGVAGQGANDATSCDAAITLYESGHWELAYERLERLADNGDALASKLALLMLRYGTSLYGMRFVATPQQVARWARQVLAATKWS
jgi:TPR repeat protein